MPLFSSQHTVGAQVCDYFRSTRTASALLALSDQTLAGLGIDRAHVRALVRRLGE